MARILKSTPAKIPNLLPGLVNKILSGDSAAEIAGWIEDQWPAADVPVLMDKAFAMLRANVQTDQVETWCLAAAQHLYREMLLIGDYAGALKAVKQIAELSRRGRPSAMPPIDI